jgi:hypothetical protein
MVGFAAKPRLARQMLQRAFEAGMSDRWMTGDVIYSSEHQFRHFPETRYMADALGIATTRCTRIPPTRGRTGCPADLTASWCKWRRGLKLLSPRYDRIAIDFSLSQRACP